MEYFLSAHSNESMTHLSLLRGIAPSASDSGSNVIKFLYAGSLVLVLVFTTITFYNRGFRVIGGVLTYLLSLSTMTLTVKNVFANHDFNYPKFLTTTHFLSSGILCFSLMYHSQMKRRKKMPVPSMEQMMKIIIPIAISFAASVGTNNIALLHCSAAFNEMISGATPLCVISLSLFEGTRFDLQLLPSILLVIIGVALCAQGEVLFTWFGFALTLLATFLRALKAHLQQKIMQDKDPTEKLEPIELLAWMSPTCLVVMAIWGGFSEGLEPFRQLNWQTSAAIGVTCVNACVLNVANNFVIRDLGAVGTNLAAQLKCVLVMMGSCGLLNEVIQVQQIAGYFVIAGGVYAYNKTEKHGQAKMIKNPKDDKNSTDVEAAQEKEPLIKLHKDSQDKTSKLGA